MKVNIISDAHLEFRDDKYIDLPGGEVLILAGDICVVKDYPDYHPFFEQCAAKYDKVFYVVGNHESYSQNINDTIPMLRRMLPEGITLLHNQSEYYGGIHWVGATLWTNFNLNVDAMEEARSYMNDFHIIRKGDRVLQPEDVLEENMETKKWFEQCIPMLKKGPVVMITHHAPSLRSIHGRYLNSSPAYANNLESFIEKHPNISHWISGHCHYSNDYTIGECRMLSNPAGYHNMEENKSFDVNLQVEIPIETPA